MPVTARAASSDQKPDRQAGGQRADAVDEDRRYQQRLAAEAIGHRAADEPADGGEGERRAEQDRDLLRGEREILDDRGHRGRDEKRQQQQIVEVEDPADEGKRENLAVNRQDRGALAEQRHLGPYVKLTGPRDDRTSGALQFPFDGDFGRLDPRCAPGMARYYPLERRTARARRSGFIHRLRR